MTTSETYRKMQDGLTESAHKIWLAGLGAVAMVEEEGSDLLTRLMERGRELQSRGREELGEARERVSDSVEDVRERATGRFDSTFRAAGDRLDDGMAAVLGRMGIPHRDEVLALTRRVERLDELVDKVRTARTQAARTVFHVAPHDEGWEILIEGTSKPVSTHGTKKDALEAARTRAKASEPSDLVIHRADGTIQSHSSYGADA